ncbi:unnamed protein product, partial [Adineta steineri]
FYLISKWSNDLTIQCGINSCKDIDEPNTSNNKVFCSSEESLLLFIDNYLLPTIDLTLSIELLITTILQSLTPMVIQLTTKWVFDLMQKYRLNAVFQSKCIQECKCINLFKLYPSFLPDNVNHSLENNNNECQK